MEMNCFQGKITINNGRIKLLEKDRNNLEIITENNKYSFENAYAYPGFTDSHGHVLALGKQLNGINLSVMNSAEECVSEAKKHVTMKGNWLIGSGWNHELWFSQVLPEAKIIDDAFPDIPVCFKRIDGHSIWVNSKAMEIADINVLTKDPRGGEIIRMKTGEPTGILIDNAMNFVLKHIPKPNRDEIKFDIVTALNTLVEAGLTEVHDMDVNPKYLEIYQELDNNNELPIRVNAFVRAQNNEWMNLGIRPERFKNFRISGIKIFYDGAIGSRGAALLEPYSDAPETRGLLMLDFDQSYEICRKGLENGFHIAAHAIGDAAVRLALDVYEKLRKNGIAKKDSVLRIEHSQHIHPTDIKRFTKNDIIAAVQPMQAISDIPMAEKRLGWERCKYSYLWKTLSNFGVVIAGGSDFPIETHKPLSGIAAFSQRKDKRNGKKWFPEEILSRDEAIEAYAKNCHLAAGIKSRATIKENFDADLTILDKNLLTCPEEKIENTKVLTVFVGGDKVF